MKFLEDRPNDVNQSLLAITRKIIVDSAIEMRLIQDDDLAFIPEVLPLMDKLAGESRDDIYNYHNKIKKSLQFPIIQRFFCYNFAKGVESAYLWHQSSSGQISFNYSLDDAIAGRVGAQVSPLFQEAINKGIYFMEDVFCDFQDKLLINPKYGFTNGGRWLADGIACGLFWASNVGVDYGMAKLGHP